MKLFHAFAKSSSSFRRAGVLTLILASVATNANYSVADAQILLSSESIASSAMTEAVQTNTSGRCYAAVCRALHPLGVELSGAAAYQAQSLLLKDDRFVPLTINSVDELRRGDIVVYTKSSTHPYGHISVYEGNFQEASDHMAPITHTKAYGGATVFRLRQEMSEQDLAIASASNVPGGESPRDPSFANASYSNALSSNRGPYSTKHSYSQSNYLPPEAYQNSYGGRYGGNPPSGSLMSAIRSDYNTVASSSTGRSLIRKAANFFRHLGD